MPQPCRAEREATAPPQPKRAELTSFLCASLASRIGPEAAADRDADLFELGLDSIDAVEVTGEIEGAFDIEVDPALLFECRTVHRAVDSLLKALASR